MKAQQVPDSQITPKQGRAYHHTGFKLYYIAIVTETTQLT